MVRRACEVGVRKGDASEGRAAKHFPGCGLVIFAEEEPRLRAAESMSPAIEDDAGDVPPGIEAGSGEHVVELLADAALVLTVGGAQQLGAPLRTLLIRRQAGVEE